ncbi:alpha-ketoglutarate-dependent dioxygenase AlkB family protein [Flagellimonas allohymeniacidonis]|uniref:Alpha-ketoglutarate-dependent dioxygenase AlkB n=1 Tax=Flagellimonas allohymeniacidonis TaxID=2517819 RepID=A0A4Q8QE98_9FLAO|nr:alpha-ketoglutarate-dependent dioxygenase AlkB [Allomuricauda hymeniacidonis]TAI46609.1 alpha-ketoglutarate-dependent dioxygenase AlkB [Allomuricauda hymeniacidonis]
MQLFSEKVRLDLPDSDIWYFANFFDFKKADDFFESLRKNTPWQQDDIKVFGKVYAQPRLTALYASNNRSYSYSNITMQPKPFTSNLLEIKTAIEEETDTLFTTCLLNLYRDGKDSNGWHSDDEKELGTNPVIASVTLGEERNFHLRHKSDRTLKHKILLQHGSLLLMKGETQHFWQHQIAKTSRNIGERINLTFRVIR